MKSYSVDYTNAARKAIDKLDQQVKSRIENWIKTNLEGCENPRFSGKALTGNLAGNGVIALVVIELLRKYKMKK